MLSLANVWSRAVSNVAVRVLALPASVEWMRWSASLTLVSVVQSGVADDYGLGHVFVLAICDLVMLS